MSLIDGSYFTGSILIPNLTYGAVSPAVYGSDILQAIVQYEADILTQLLGYSLYKLLLADLDGDGNPQTERFTNLIDGAEFTNDYIGTDQTLKWNGFRNTAKISLIAYYVFYKYVERNANQMSVVGNTDLKSEDSDKVSPIRKMTDAFYEMRKLYGIIPPYIRFWHDSVLGSELPSVYNDLSSAYNFLFANKVTYPEWVFTPQKGVNIFGL
ncbi:MAG: hypothetical protein HN347_01210 [Bacteroidetes bacterium]|jgi:hypothetical protein|nr:hypothetical protein [Bacteroidota bacterium]